MKLLRKCSWCEKNEDWSVWSHVHPFLPEHAHHLGPNWAIFVPKYTVFNISRIWFIRFRWNFEEMFLVWKEWRLMSLVTCLPILARAWTSFRPNSTYIENSILWDQIWPNLGTNDGRAQARMGEYVTKLISHHSFHTKNISWKFHRNLMNQIQDMLKNSIFWDKILPNLGLTDGHAGARMGKHETKLVSPDSFHTKNISSRFHRNQMNQIQDICWKQYILGPNVA